MDEGGSNPAPPVPSRSRSDGAERHPDRGVVARLLAPAMGLVDPAGLQAVGQFGRQQGMVDAKAVVALPGACLMARRQGGAAWVLPCLLAMGGNLTNSWLQAHLLAPITLLTLLSAASALALGLALLRHDDWRVPAVGRWGYLFYPVHLLVIKVLS